MPLNKFIEFKNVSFRYSKKNKFILKNLNLIIKKGENWFSWTNWTGKINAY